MARDRKEADRVMGAGQRILLKGDDSDAGEVVEVVEVVLLQDEVGAAHRPHRHRKVTAEVPTDLAWAAVEEGDKCCATLHRSRLPTCVGRDLVVDERTDLVAHALNQGHSYPPSCLLLNTAGHRLVCS